MDQNRPTSWGLCSAGKICNDFALALNSLPNNEHKIGAVAARDITRAKSFADSHSIPKAYGSYDDLANDPDIDIVYIGAIHTTHYDLSIKMLQAGKHVLCEKPLCVNYDETKKLVEFARKKKLFLMEGVWSRCFPAYEKAKEIIQNGDIGEVRFCHATFGSHFDFPLPRIERKDMAGGSLLDIGIYAVQFAQFAFNNEKPIMQVTDGSLLQSGVDSDANILLKYPNNRSATVSSSVKTFLSNEGSIHGTKGYIKLGPFFWCPTTVEVYEHHNKKETFTFDLPALPEKGKYNFRNSQGLQYEAMEVRRCLLKGLTESPLHTLDDSITVSVILQQARMDIGYELPQDNVKR